MHSFQYIDMNRASGFLFTEAACFPAEQGLRNRWMQSVCQSWRLEGPVLPVWSSSTKRRNRCLASGKKNDKQNGSVHIQGVDYAIEGVYQRAFNRKKPLVQMPITKKRMASVRSKIKEISSVSFLSFYFLIFFSHFHFSFSSLDLSSGIRYHK